MELERRITAFAQLGKVLRKFGAGAADSSVLKEAAIKASQKNGWFTEKNILLALTSLGEMLRGNKIRKWISGYNIPPAPLQRGKERQIGVIMAGNIPLVGFHDFLCVLMSGNIFAGKLSSDDEFLLPAVAKILTEIEPELIDKIRFASPLTPLSSPLEDGVRPTWRTRRGEEACSAYIATGSSNSARYFEYYFKKYPHIIRKNRNAIAILDGSETEDDLKNLGKDIFQYFGMGCRNVSKIFIPQDYDLDKFFSAIAEFGDVINHNKYANNYNYYRTIYLLNKEKFLDNNFLLVKESKQIASPVATLFYERYESKEKLFLQLEVQKENIQCVVSASPLTPLLSAGRRSPSDLADKERGMKRIAFGNSQSPELWDYADGVDTMEFLLGLPGITFPVQV